MRALGFSIAVVYRRQCLQSVELCTDESCVCDPLVWFCFSWSFCKNDKFYFQNCFASEDIRSWCHIKLLCNINCLLCCTRVGAFLCRICRQALHCFVNNSVAQNIGASAIFCRITVPSDGVYGRHLPFYTTNGS